jgi:23S rRNA (pseudouridine1915-N3)-methyltransferase
LLLKLNQMKVTLLVCGKTEADYLNTGIGIYEKRLAHFLPFDRVVVPALKENRNLTQAQQKQREGELLLTKVAVSDLLILLDEKGKQFSSVQFSEWINQKMMGGTKRLVFVIGGPYGFSDELYQRADELLSLSAMTFSHQMVRLIFTEQLYRAFSILKGLPYHHA